MRSQFAFFVTMATLFVISPVLAGTTENQGPWHPTQCVEPPVPPLLADADPDSSAAALNVLMIEYNQYVHQSQSYMECVSNEAHLAAEVAGQAIMNDASLIIENTKSKVAALGGPLRPQK